MKRKTLIPLAVIAILFALGVAAFAFDDSVVSLSDLKLILISPMEEWMRERVDSLAQGGGSSRSPTQQEKDALARAAASRLAGGSIKDLDKGARIEGPLGGGFILLEGEGKINSVTGSDLVDASSGVLAVPGTMATVGTYYLIGAENGCGMVITSNKARVAFMDGAGFREGYTPVYKSQADNLSELGIFRGTELGYELERAPTRQEALIMLIRLLGEEDEALAFSGESQFTDLTGWADGKKYISYSAVMGYTNGVTDTTFNQYGSASRHMYLTYVLRALGYDDKSGDFIWNSTSDDLALSLGLMTSDQLAQMEKEGFFRDHVVLISFNALNAKMKDGSMSLAEKLALSGKISWENYLRLR